MIVDSLFNLVDEGRSGKNQGFRMGLSKLEGYIDGVTRDTNTLIFSNSGSGKTSLLLYSYIYEPLCEHIDDDKYDIIYFSLEMKAEILLAKLLSTHLFFKYGVQVGVKELLSRKRGYRLDDDLYKLIKECEPWMRKIEKHLYIYDKAVNAETMYAVVMEQLKKYGTFSETENRVIYTSNDPEHVLLGVVDHASLFSPNKGRSLKEEIDLCSKFSVTIRNRTGMSWVFIQQANRDQGNIERFKQGKSAFTLNDTKDSGDIVQNSEIVLAIYNPHRDGLKTYKGNYDISKIESYFRSIMILKNRYGESEIEIPVNFFGKVNVWRELPRSEEIYDYEKYKDPNYILEGDIEPKSNNVKTEISESPKSNFSFKL